MVNEQRGKKIEALFARGHKVGDILETCDNEQAIVRECLFTSRRHFVVSFDPLITDGVDPRFILVSYHKYRGPALKAYCNDKRATKKVRVTRVSEKSLQVERVE